MLRQHHRHVAAPTGKLFAQEEERRHPCPKWVDSVEKGLANIGEQ
jgi:hypothetical protein